MGSNRIKKVVAKSNNNSTPITICYEDPHKCVYFVQSTIKLPSISQMLVITFAFIWWLPWRKKPKRLEVIFPPQPFHCRFKPEARQKLVIRVYLTSALPSSYHHCDLFRQNSRVECFLYSSWWISLFFQWGGVSFVWHLMEHYQSQLPYLAFPTRHSVVANIFCVCIDFGCCCSQ